MIGSHNPGQGLPSSPVAPRVSVPRNGKRVGFSNSRKAQRATSGMIGNLARGRSIESDKQYSQRMSRREYVQQVQHETRVRRIAIIVVVIVAALLIAGFVGRTVFMNSVSSKMALEDAAIKQALVAPAADKPYYTLIVADLNASQGTQNDPDALILARVDEQTPSVQLYSIPSNLRVVFSDGNAHLAREAAQYGGYAALIPAVAAALDIEISHFAYTTADGLVALAGKEGIEVTLTEEVDDPTAGSTYIAAGTQKLSGEALLTYLRASNFSEGIKTQGKNQCDLFTTMTRKAIEPKGLGFASSLDTVAANVHTDYNADGAFALADVLRRVDDSHVGMTMIPGTQTLNTATNTKRYTVDAEQWKAIQAKVDSGKFAWFNDDDEAASVDRGSFTVMVKNGSGITGGASTLADILKSAGYNVTDTGNADSYVYNETLVIYKDEAMKPAAESIVKTLGTGRAISAGTFYSFDQDIMVVLGSDWKPLN